MSKKRNIDDLFKGSLQNFEETPSPQVWNAIQSQLKEEKEDRAFIIPLWWKLGGVAAVLALLLVANVVFDPFGNETENQIVTTQEDSDIKHPENVVMEKHRSTQGLSSEEHSSPISEEKKGQNSKENNVVPNKGNVTDLASETSNKNKSSKSQVKSESLQPSIISENTVANTSSKKSKFVEKQVSQEQLENVGVATNKNPNNLNDPQNTSSESISEKDKIKEAVAISTNTTVKNEKLDVEPNKKFVEPISKGVETESAITKEEISPDASKETEEQEKKSIFDAIEEKDKTEVAVKEDKDARKWEVTPNFGPVFYNSIQDGSSIDASFADNSQNSETNFSYGVQVSYAINDRLSVRSGVNNVDLGYTTNGIELATGPVSAALKSVDYGSKNTVLTAVDKGAFQQNTPGEGMNPFDNLNPKSTGGNAALTQNLSYYEVPFELNYALVDTRFGVDMIGGFSTLFLGDNEIVATDGDFRQVLGGANNLNSVSFSTNVGVGFNYKISKRLQFNLEPMFKYQLNPYTDSSVDFKPYYLGVYSGLSFKF